MPDRFTLEKQADAMHDAANMMALLAEIKKVLGPHPSVQQVRDWLKGKRQNGKAS